MKAVIEVICAICVEPIRPTFVQDSEDNNTCPIYKLCEILWFNIPMIGTERNDHNGGMIPQVKICEGYEADITICHQDQVSMEGYRSVA